MAYFSWSLRCWYQGGRLPGATSGAPPTFERTGELGDAAQASTFLLRTVDALVIQGERRKFVLSNRAIEAYRRYKNSTLALVS